MQVLLCAMLIHVLHAALEDAVNADTRVGSGIAAHILLGVALHDFMA